MRHLILLISVLLLPNYLQAEAIQIDVSADKVLGLSRTSTEDDFIKIIGKPTAIIDMGKEHQGLLYGEDMMLIFWHGSLWQVRTWKVKGWSSDLYTGWLQYIPKDQHKNVTFSILGKFNLGDTRREVERLLQAKVVDGDEYSIVSQIGNADVWLGFDYVEDSTGNKVKDVYRQKLVSISVTFQSSETK